MKFTIALAQIDTVLGDVKKNIAKHLDVIKQAKGGGADLIVFPELSLSGYAIKDMNWNVAVSASNTTLLQPLLKASDEISIVVGTVEESAEYGIYNSAFFIEDGNVLHVHRKIYLPTYGMFEEMRYFSQGKSVHAFQSKLGKFGLLVCEDLWHPALPYVLAKDEAQFIIGIAASPTRLSGNEARIQNAQVNIEHHKAYARLLSSYIVFCNRVGFEDGVNFWGGSEIVAPSGDILVQAKLFEEDLVFAEIDGNELRRARRLSRHYLDDDIEIVLDELLRIKHKRL